MPISLDYSLSVLSNYPQMREMYQSHFHDDSRPLIGSVLTLVLASFLLRPFLYLLQVLVFLLVSYSVYYLIADSAQIRANESARKISTVGYILLEIYLVKMLL